MKPRFPDPLAPLSEKMLRKRARQDVLMQERPIAAALAKQARAGQLNIVGVSNDLATRLGDYQGAQAGIYSHAQQQLGDFNREAANRLGANSGADELRQRLAAAGQDPGLADKLASMAQAASGSGFVRGGQETNALGERSAAAQDYAAKLPGIARLSGLQDVNQRQAQQQSDLTSLQSKAQGLLQQSIQNGRNLEFQKAATNLGFKGDTYKVDAANQRATDSNYVKLKAIAAANARSGMTLKERAKHNRVSEKEQATRDAERARHDKQAETQAQRSARERARHNRQTEKKKGKGGGGPPSLGG